MTPSASDEAIAALRVAGPAQCRELMMALDKRAFDNQQSNPEQALADLREARAIAALDGQDSYWRGLTTRGANACERIGDLIGARQLYAEGEPPSDAPANEKYAWANGCAVLAERLGDWQAATRHYDAAVALFGQLTEIGENSLFALSNAATWMAGNGQTERAIAVLEQFKRALAHQTKTNVTYEVAMMEAQIALATGDLKKAERAWAEVGDILGKTGQGAALPIVAEERAMVLVEMERRDDAIALLRSHVEADEQKTASGYANELMAAAIALGGLLAEDGDAATFAEARAILRRALASEASRGMPEAEWRILSGLAETAARLKNSPSAVIFGKAAVAIIAQLDTGQPYPAHALRDLNRRQRPYRRLVARLIDAGRFPEAARIDDMMKQEAVFDLGRRDGHLDGRVKAVPLRPAEETALNAYRDICNESRLANARQHGLADAAGAGAPAIDPHAARIAIVAWADGLLAGEGADRDATSSARHAEPAPLADGELELRFLRTGAGWHVLARTQQGMTDFRAGNAENIARDIFAFRRAIIRERHDWMEPARSLFDRLLRPVDDLISNARHLLLRTDVPAGYLPFAALHDGERFLIERVTMTSGTGLTPPPREAVRQEDWRIVLLGNEDRDGRRIPHVENEMQSILDSQPAARRVVPFNAETLAAALASGPKIVHLASHFHLEPGRPDLSFLSLDGDAPLTLERLRSAEFPLSNVELLVLSACDTAVEDAGTHGLESLAGLAQVKGARQVLGTLWPVQDASAARLMGLFHAGLRAGQQASLRWADNLRAAQLKLLREGGAESGTTRAGGLSMPKRTAWSHPFHWAGYVLYR